MLASGSWATLLSEWYLNMPRRVCTLESHVFLKPLPSQKHGVAKIIESIPSGFEPEFFSASERLKRSEDYSMKNSRALCSAVVSNKARVFWGDGYVLHYSQCGYVGEECQLYAYSRRIGEEFVCKWIANITSLLLYANAGAPAEYEHRNGYEFRIAPNGRCHGWFGRDIRRYVPGLYWHNYFSDTFVTTHGIDLIRLATEFKSEYIQHNDGVFLKLYQHSNQWQDMASAVDSVISATRGFFSRRGLSIPIGVVSPEESLRITSELSGKWR